MRAPLIALVVVLAAAPFSAQTAPGTVMLIPAADTTAAFAKGRPLIETGAYKVHASRRDAPGQAEIHQFDTDIFHVLDGSATIVTGGEIVGATETGPGERRGASITGGVPRALTKGDVLIIPAGIAHQYTAVKAPFLYYTVKITATR
jgi:mannose-6-phosphate isomerase-like protein (cupin superfamily)